MNIKVTKEGLKTVGNAGLKIGKSIIVEGTKSVALQATGNVFVALFDKKKGGVKGLTVDKVLGNDKKTKRKLALIKKGSKLFKKKDKEEIKELAEEVVETIDVDTTVKVKED